MAGAFFSSAAANALGTLMVDYLVKPIDRRIRYLCSLHKIVHELHQQKRNLNRELTRVKRQVEEAELQIQTQVIEDYVIQWLTDAKDALNDVQNLETRIEEYKRCFGWCPNWIRRYRLSKESEKKTECMSKLVKDSHFEPPIGRPAELPGLEFFPSEAWTLFRMKAKLDERLSRAIMEEAEKVAKECKGLPVAIVTLAAALKGTTSHRDWKIARKKLESSRLIEIGNIEEEEENAYRCVKMSFDYLKKDTTKRCFLFCALYPEDHSIDVEELVRYAWGLELYGQSNESVEDVRIQVLQAVKYLKESCLLLEDGDVAGHVKLHDIVRDVALWIASKEESGFTIQSRLTGSFETCKAISLLSDEEKKFPERLAHSKLEMLLLNNCDAQGTYFQRMRELKVLSLTIAKYSSMNISLYALTLLGKLRSLSLKNLEYFSFLGNIRTLEILTLRGSSLEGLAEELVRLENLKILDVTGCTFSSRWLPNVIGRMLKLEELYLKGTDIQRDFDDTLREINSLSRLTALSLEVSSFRFKKGSEFPKLERYDISIGGGRRKGSYCFINLTEKSWEIQQVIPLNVVSLLLLPASLESLELSENADEFMECLTDKGLKLSNLKLLRVSNLSRISELPMQHVRVEGLVDLRMRNCPNLKLLFPLSLVPSLVSLETLEVFGCHGLKQIVTESRGDGKKEEISSAINSRKSLCFPKLKKIDIGSCDGLEFIFPTLMAQQGFQGLSLSLWDCPQLKQVIKVDNEQLHFLGSLSSFSLGDCPLFSARLEAMEARLTGVRLSTFKRSFNRSKQLQLTEAIEDHNVVPEGNEDGLNGLTWLEVERCKYVECLVDTTTGNSPTSAFTHLEILRIKGSDGLETLCKGQPPQGLLKNLKELTVEECDKLLVVFQLDDPPYNGEQNKEKPLSNLQSLNLSSLQELRWILKGSAAHSFGLQSLKVVNIEDCGKLEYLFSPSLTQSLVMLEKLKIERCDELKVLLPEPENDGEIESNNSSLPLCLPKLKILDIRWCGKLEYAVTVTLAQGLPALASLSIFDCEELKQVFGMGNGQDGAEHDGEIESNSSSLPLNLPKLKNLEIYCCSKLEYVVPITSAHGLPALESLTVSRCSELKQVFGMEKEGEGVEHHGIVCLVSLQDVRLEQLTNLTGFVPENYIVKAPALKSIRARDCPKVINFSIQQASKQLKLETNGLSIFKKLSYNTDSLHLHRVDQGHKIPVLDADLRHLDRITSLDIVFCHGGECLVDTSEARKGEPPKPFLQNLKTLRMKYCNNMLEVLRIDKGLYNRVENQPPRPPPLLTNLEYLQLEHLYKLRRIVKGPANLQSLKVLSITNCEELRWLFSVSVVQTLGSLEQFKIDGCNELKSVFMELESDDNGTESDTLCLPNLKTIEIEDCRNLVYVFPLALAPVFPRLQKLQLVNLRSLRSVVAGNNCLEAPALEILDVLRCSALTGISLLNADNKYAPLKKLTYISVGGIKSKNMENSRLCQRSPNFEYITIGNFEQQLHLQGGYFISNLEKIHLGNLIWLRDIWKGPVHVATNLTRVVIFKCNRLTYIFPMMLIPHLPQLSSLEISSCKNLKQIIANDDILASSSAQGPQLEKKMIFPQLKRMEITKSPRLESLTPIGFHLVFPCLEELTLKKNYKMMTNFTVDYLMLIVHAKTNLASQVDHASPSQEDILWERSKPISLPQYVEEAEEISPLK
ncbi:hypothetical protein V6N13_049911 [Hibiscus sabdariffa]